MSHDPTFMAHNGDVWRSSHAPHFHWSSLMPITCERLLMIFRANQQDPADWFHKRAGLLADELQAAMTAASEQRQGRAAA